MKTDRELLEDALNVLDKGQWIHPSSTLHNEIRARLAEPEDEPVCWFDEDDCSIEMAFEWDEDEDHTIPLYRHPPRQPVRLSDDEIQECFDIAQKNFSKHQTGIKGQQLTIRDWPNWHFAKAIEQAIMEKNK
jgi:Tfp pilus assembly protein FimV